MEVRFRFIIIFILLLASELAFAGAWVQKPCEGLNIFTYRRYLSGQYWTSSGRLTGSPQYAKNEIDEYFEFGLTKRFTIGGYYSALRAREGFHGVRGGSNDHLVLGRYLLWSDDYHALSIQIYVDKFGRAAQFDVPPQNTSYSSGEQIWYGKSGQIKLKKPINWFVDGEIGLVQRYGLNGQISLLLEGGLKFNDDKFWWFLQSYGTIAMTHPSNPHQSDYDLFTVAPSIVYWFNKAFAVQTGIAQDIYGQNVGKGTCPFASIWLKF